MYLAISPPQETHREISSNDNIRTLMACRPARLAGWYCHSKSSYKTYYRERQPSHTRSCCDVAPEYCGSFVGRCNATAAAAAALEQQQSHNLFHLMAFSCRLGTFIPTHNGRSKCMRCIPPPMRMQFNFNQRQTSLTAGMWINGVSIGWSAGSLYK